MEKQIKVIYWLTSIALIALVVIQGYWLFNQYIYTLQKYEEELFQKTTDINAIDRKLRKEHPDKHLQIKTEWQMNVLNTTNSDPETEWIINTYITDKNKKHQFVIKGLNRQDDIFDAIEQFRINELCPFQVERIDSLLQEQGIKALSINTEITDSMIWNPRKISYSSIWNPTMEVTYPFNILQKEQVRVTYKLGGSPILGKMLESLLCSIALSLLLMFCLIYQIRTIFKQQRIEKLRKDFIKTMIHELKRPVATLKLCISFIKNDKMMQDTTMKEDIIRSSQNELDNLSSYFSKLRDLTYGDLEEIPLNFSTFNVKSLVEECIDKQNIPTDRQINFKASFDNDDTEITADRMHMVNILCNLLENAVKYSEGDTSIHIDCRSKVNKYQIEVSDNGFGIPSTECNYVFNKYFRSTSITDKNIPGIGLGLCYVKLLVTAHNGRISLESTLGIGSKFTIEIPGNQ